MCSGLRCGYHLGTVQLHGSVAGTAWRHDERDLPGGLRLDEQPVGGRLAQRHLLQRGRLGRLGDERQPAMRMYAAASLK